MTEPSEPSAIDAVDLPPPPPDTGLSCGLAGDTEYGLVTRLDFVTSRPSPVRFGWVCVCAKRDPTRRTYEDAGEAMREHARAEHPNDVRERP